VVFIFVVFNISCVRLGPFVINFLIRYFVVMASAVSSVDELLGGCAIFGFGSGDSVIYIIGAPFVMFVGFEDAVVTFGRFIGGELIDW